MTINQYQRLAKTIAEKLIDLGGNPKHVRYIKSDNGVELNVRDPHKDDNLSITSGDSNTVLVFHMMSNPNNPNYMYRTLKPGSISAFNSELHENHDLTTYHFDSAQFKKLIDLVKNTNWTIN